MTSLAKLQATKLPLSVLAILLHDFLMINYLQIIYKAVLFTKSISQAKKCYEIARMKAEEQKPLF